MSTTDKGKNSTDQSAAAEGSKSATDPKRHQEGTFNTPRSTATKRHQGGSSSTGRVTTGYSQRQASSNTTTPSPRQTEEGPSSMQTPHTGAQRIPSVTVITPIENI